MSFEQHLLLIGTCLGRCPQGPQAFEFVSKRLYFSLTHPQLTAFHSFTWHVDRSVPKARSALLSQLLFSFFPRTVKKKNAIKDTVSVLYWVSRVENEQFVWFRRGDFAKNSPAEAPPPCGGRGPKVSVWSRCACDEDGCDDEDDVCEGHVGIDDDDDDDDDDVVDDASFVRACFGDVVWWFWLAFVGCSAFSVYAQIRVSRV